MNNGSLAASGGILWYLQFFFYASGAANIPLNYAYVNWMLHMSGYVLFGGIVGLAMGEWIGVGSKPVRLLWSGNVGDHRGGQHCRSRHGVINDQLVSMSLGRESGARHPSLAVYSNELALITSRIFCLDFHEAYSFLKSAMAE